MLCPRGRIVFAALMSLIGGCYGEDSPGGAPPASAVPPAVKVDSAAVTSASTSAGALASSSANPSAGASASAAPSVPEVLDPQQRAVRDLFIAYQKAVLGRMGKAAAAVVSEKT